MQLLLDNTAWTGKELAPRRCGQKPEAYRLFVCIKNLLKAWVTAWQNDPVQYRSVCSEEHSHMHDLSRADGVHPSPSTWEDCADDGWTIGTTVRDIITKRLKRGAAIGMRCKPSRKSSRRLGADTLATCRCLRRANA